LGVEGRRAIADVVLHLGFVGPDGLGDVALESSLLAHI
jgi:hypothetical protein